MTDAVRTAVTALFVPGDRPDRYAKAAASGADLVIIDLEDAVAPSGKDAARASVRSALGAGATLRALVRINDPRTPAGAADLATVGALGTEPGHGVIGVMVPKVGRIEDLRAVIETVAPPPSPGGPVSADDVHRLAVVALIESALGVAEVRALAVLPGLTRLAFGALDFALDVGADVEALTGQVARAQVVIASRAAGLPAPWESPSTSLSDTRLIEESSRAARVLGFGGRLCIHPAQLEPVRAGFAPSDDDVAWARRVAGAGDAVSRVGDEMVDRPVLERARAILRRVR